MELLVVIAIIAILSALLLSALHGARARAHSTNCRSLLHQMGAALQMYTDENRGKFPDYRGLPDASLDAATGPEHTADWSAKLVPYYHRKPTERAHHCPGYKGAISWSMGSFAYNSLGVGRRGRPNDHQELGLGGWLSLAPRRHGTSELQVRVPSGMFAIGESRWKASNAGIEGANDWMICGILTVNRGGLAFDPARHGRNYNQLFCDGHVSAMSPWVLFNPTNTAAMWNYDHLPHSESWPRGL